MTTSLMHMQTNTSTYTHRQADTLEKTRGEEDNECAEELYITYLLKIHCHSPDYFTN